MSVRYNPKQVVTVRHRESRCPRDTVEVVMLYAYDMNLGQENRLGYQKTR